MTSSVQDKAGAPDLWTGAAPAPKPRPHFVEHRARLRERAAAGGLAALPDYELLELFLFRSIPRQDVKARAKALLDRFGSLAGVLGASAQELGGVDGVGEAVALDLTALHEVSLRAARDQVARRPLISLWSA